MFELWTAWGFVRDYWPWIAGGLGVMLLVLFYAFLTKRITVALEALAGLAVLLAAGRIYRKGAASQKARTDAAADRAVEATREEQRKVDRMDDAEVDRELDRWIPKEKKP